MRAELGDDSKDADSEMDLALLNVLTTCEGEKSAIFIRDCAALGYNAENVAGFPATLGDSKLFDMVMSLFFFQNHGKSWVDKIFGAIEGRHRLSYIFSADTMMLPLESLQTRPDVQRVDSYIDCSVVDPSSMTDWSSFLSAHYRVCA